jgi:hypothetical protein
MFRWDSAEDSGDFCLSAFSSSISVTLETLSNLLFHGSIPQPTTSSFSARSTKNNTHHTFDHLTAHYTLADMRSPLSLPLTLALAALLKPVTAYQVEIHPEYQQGLAINDVPAERRLHWMRVANEVGRL